MFLMHVEIEEVVIVGAPSRYEPPTYKWKLSRTYATMPDFVRRLLRVYVSCVLKAPISCRCSPLLSYTGISNYLMLSPARSAVRLTWVECSYTLCNPFSDFSCGDFSGIEPETSAACTTPSSSGRRRSFSQAWDALTPKTLPDAHVNPGLLAGVWNQAVVTVTSTKSQIDDLEATRIGNFEARSQVLEQEVAPESIGPLREESRGKACRGRRAPGGTKRPLNPDRMERKATREKRRREEVRP